MQLGKMDILTLGRFKPNCPGAFPNTQPLSPIPMVALVAGSRAAYGVDLVAKLFRQCCNDASLLDLSQCL